MLLAFSYCLFVIINYLFNNEAKRDLSREALFLAIKPFDAARSIADEAEANNSCKLPSPVSAATRNFFTSVRYALSCEMLRSRCTLFKRARWIDDSIIGIAFPSDDKCQNKNVINIFILTTQTKLLDQLTVALYIFVT